MLKVWLTTKRQSGFSPVEVLLAATILGFLTTALIGAIIYGNASTAGAGDRARAVYYAEEGLEAVRNIGDASFSNLVDSGTNTTLGNTTIESGSDFNSNGATALRVNTGSASGTVTSISVYVKFADSPNSSVQAAIYADNGSGTSPTTRLGVSGVQTAVANSWNNFAISGVTVSASTNYWIVFSENGATTFANTSTGGVSAYRVTGGYPAPNPFTPDSSNTTDRPSFYMNVSSSGSTQGLAQSGGQWAFSGTSDTNDIFTRYINVSSAGNNRKKITSTVSWPQGTTTGQVSVDTYMTNWAATIVTTGPAMMAYSKNSVTPYYRIWNGSSWGAEGTAQNVSSGGINYVVVKSSRTRNEAIMGVQTSTGGIFIQTWNGSTWSNLTQVGTGTNTTRSFDIAYEKNGDRAIVVYSPTAASVDFAYRIWNGTSLSSPTTVTTPPTTGALNWIELDQNPVSTSNDIAMMLLDANADTYGMVWTGGAWSSMGTATTWDTTVGSASKKAIDVEYEQTSGRAMFMWGDAVATDQYYRIWNGTSLTVATLLDIPAEGGVPEWVQLAARPNSNELLLGVQDAASDLNTRKWSGTAWDTATNHPEHAANVESILSRSFDIVWETNPATSGKAWILWGNGNDVSTRAWTGTWATAAVLTGSDDTSFIRLRADAVSGVVWGGFYEDATALNKQIYESRITVGATSWSGKTIMWTGPTDASPVYFRIDITAP